MAKDTLYVEADDEITVVIDKVTSAKNKVVALVLPKRATVFQSVVNMKLLGRAAKESQKSLVLISSEDAIRSIAGVAGIHVASSLNSKPEIPKKAATRSAETTVAVDDNVDDTSSVVGAAAVAATLSGSALDTDAGLGENDVIKMDDDPGATSASSAAAIAVDKKSKAKKFKIPDFTTFKIKMVAGVVIVALLIGGWFYGFIIAPKAKVIINAETSRTTVGYEFTANAKATEADYENRALPAKLAEVTKENKVTIQTTGQKNKGEKATGNVDFTAKVCAPNLGNSPDDLSSGTPVNVGDKVYILQDDMSFQFVNFTGGSCANYSSSGGDVVARDAGAALNVNSVTATVSGRADVSGILTASGGTDNIVKIVSADDLKNAAAQLKGSSSAEASTELRQQLTDQGKKPLEQTLEEGAPAQKNSASEGTEVAEVTVTQTVSYKMLGISEEDMVKLLDAQIQAQLKKDNVSKNVRSNGLDKAAIRLINKASTEQQVIGVQTVATLGPNFDLEAIKNDIVGKKRGDIEKMIEARDSVKSVDVVYSPGWVTTTPKSAKKITIEVNEVEN